MMKRDIMMRFAHVVALVLLPLAASGQNLDPTVRVNKIYEGRLMEVEKPQLEMAVPDSVLRFDLDFDYSVTETPYQGTYEFNPYSLEMKPSPVVRDRNSFYLKAGAGYQLHPVFDMKWSPKLKVPFMFNAYASHGSFLGNYWKISENQGVALTKTGRSASEDRTWFGYDLVTRAGIDGRYDWKALAAAFDVSYEGLHQKDVYEYARSYNSAEARLGAASKYEDGLRFKFDSGYRFAQDDMPSGDVKPLVESDFDLNMMFGYKLPNGGLGAVDFVADFVSTTGAVETGAGEIDLLPHYVMNFDRWRVDLGLRISTVFRTVDLKDSYDYKEQFLYPNVRVDCRLVPNALNLYLEFGGDCGVNSYSDMLKFNRHSNLNYGRGIWDMFGVSEESITAVIGLEGHAGYRFSYGIKGGYVNVGSAILEGVVKDSEGGLLPALGYSSFDKAFVEADWLLLLNGLKFDGSVEYVHTWNRISPMDRRGLFMPPAVKGEASVSYTWKNRIMAGIDCGFSTCRKGGLVDNTGEDVSVTEAKIPGYADLGLDFEYVISRKFSVWARGGNLLGMTIQRETLFAERGPYFTAGVTLNL